MSATNSPHFQLFSLDGKTDIRWRLLSANNRDLGRGYSMYETVADCLSAISHVLAELDSLVTLVRRRDGNLWQWTLAIGDQPLVTSGHGYDRQVRSEQAAGRFRSQAGTARLSEEVIETGARRRGRASINEIRSRRW